MKILLMPPSFFFFLPSLLSLFFLFCMENFRDLFRNSTYMLPPLLPSRTLQLDKYLSKYTNHLVNSFTTFPCACTLQYLHTTKKRWRRVFLLRRKVFGKPFLVWVDAAFFLSLKSFPLPSLFFIYLFILWTMLFELEDYIF